MSDTLWISFSNLCSWKRLIHWKLETSFWRFWLNHYWTAFCRRFISIIVFFSEDNQPLSRLRRCLSLVFPFFRQAIWSQQDPSCRLAQEWRVCREPFSISAFLDLQRWIFIQRSGKYFFNGRLYTSSLKLVFWCGVLLKNRR